MSGMAEIERVEKTAAAAAKKFVAAVAFKYDPMSNGTMGEFSENSRRAHEAGHELFAAMRDLAIVTTPAGRGPSSEDKNDG